MANIMAKYITEVNKIHKKNIFYYICKIKVLLHENISCLTMTPAYTKGKIYTMRRPEQLDFRTV